MGKFAKLHKEWKEAKKSVPDDDESQKRAKKAFAEGLGPILDELDTVADDLLEARKSKFNPDLIHKLSPKVEKLCQEAAKVADKYRAAAAKQDWDEVQTVAKKIKGAVDDYKDIEVKQWKPNDEYLDLWRYATLEMALSAAGLEDARTAEDLRKIVEKKNKAISAGRKEDAGIKQRIEQLSIVWSKGKDFEQTLKIKTDRIAEGAAMAREIASPSSGEPPAYDAPAKLGKLAASIKSTLKFLVDERKRAVADLKTLKAYIKSTEVQTSAWKKQGEESVDMGEQCVKWFNAAIFKAGPIVVSLPKLS